MMKHLMMQQRLKHYPNNNNNNKNPGLLLASGRDGAPAMAHKVSTGPGKVTVDWTVRPSSWKVEEIIHCNDQELSSHDQRQRH
jgi:hypothetical protein